MEDEDSVSDGVKYLLFTQRGSKVVGVSVECWAKGV